LIGRRRWRGFGALLSVEIRSDLICRADLRQLTRIQYYPRRVNEQCPEPRPLTGSIPDPYPHDGRSGLEGKRCLPSIDVKGCGAFRELDIMDRG